MAKRRGIAIDDLPEKYRRQVRDQIAVRDSFVEPDIRHGAEEKNEVQKVNPPVRIKVHSKRQRPADIDGLSAKWIIDSLVIGGIIENDDPTILREVTYTQEKVKSKDECETIITIEHISS